MNVRLDKTARTFDDDRYPVRWMFVDERRVGSACVDSGLRRRHVPDHQVILVLRDRHPRTRSRRAVVVGPSTSLDAAVDDTAVLRPDDQRRRRVGLGRAA